MGGLPSRLSDFPGAAPVTTKRTQLANAPTRCRTELIFNVRIAGQEREEQIDTLHDAYRRQVWWARSAWAVAGVVVLVR